VWANEETRAKFHAVHSSPEWRAERARIAAEASSRWIAVDCSDGRHFKKMADAARAFGIRNAGMKHLVLTQRVGRLGVAFKLASEQWRSVLSVQEQRMATMQANGTNVRTAEARAKMSASAKSRKAA